jgi:hypothetical protein
MRRDEVHNFHYCAVREKWLATEPTDYQMLEVAFSVEQQLLNAFNRLAPHWPMHE